MNRFTRLGVGIAIASIAYASISAYAAEPDGASQVGGDNRVPVRAAVDKEQARAALGDAAAEVSVRTGKLAPQLTVPPGASSYREGLWHLGATTLGTVRVYEYATPVNVPARNWRTARWFKGRQAPHFVTDRYGVVGLAEVSVYVDTAGKVVSVQPTGFTSLSEVTLEANPAGTEEMGD